MTNPQPAPDTQPSPALLSAFKRTQERNRELEAFIRWEDELFSNPHLSGNHKLEIRATRRAVQRAQTHDAQGRARINLTTIAEQIGISPDTMGRGVLATWDIRSKRERYWVRSQFIFLAIHTSRRWGEGLLHDCVFPGFRTDIPSGMPLQGREENESLREPCDQIEELFRDLRRK